MNYYLILIHYALKKKITEKKMILNELKKKKKIKEVIFLFLSDFLITY